MGRADELFRVGALGIAFEARGVRVRPLKVAAGYLHCATAFLQRAVPSCL